jgi:anti-sigma factor RsiW
MTTHDEYLELAAASLDFELSQAERDALAGHLAGCVACRRRVIGLQADQRAIAQMPVFELSPAGVARVRRGSGQGGRRTQPVLRLVALAAMLALLAGAFVAVGSAVLRRDQDVNLGIVPPSPSESDRTPSASIAPTAPPSTEGFAAGSILEVVTSDLRVRTAPTVDNAISAKLEPLLDQGTQLRVIEGPVTADGYDWYHVQAIGLPHDGWVAAADHDGAPWIEDLTTAASPAPALSADELALVANLRADAASDCEPRRTRLPALAIAGVECRVNSALIDRIGAYMFKDPGDAAVTYLERLATYDVGPASGDCLGGTSGDAAWMPGDGASGTDATSVDFRNTGPWSVGRSGCFLDEDGTANARATCGSTYIGVLGLTNDLAAVQRWLWMSHDGPVAPGEPPGICKSAG